MSWSLRSMLITELTSPDWPLADPAAGPGSLTVGQVRALGVEGNAWERGEGP